MRTGLLTSWQGRVAGRRPGAARRSGLAAILWLITILSLSPWVAQPAALSDLPPSHWGQPQQADLTPMPWGPLAAIEARGVPSAAGQEISAKHPRGSAEFEHVPEPVLAAGSAGDPAGPVAVGTVLHFWSCTGARTECAARDPPIAN